MRVAELGGRVASADRTGPRIDLLQRRIAEIGFAQAGYLALGQDPTPWFHTVSGLLAEISAETAAIAPDLHSEAAARELRSFADRTSELVQIDAHARESVLIGDTPAASLVIVEESSAVLKAMLGMVVSLRGAEATAAHGERLEALASARQVLVAVAVIWTLGVIALISGSFARRRILTEPLPAHPQAEKAGTTSIDVNASAELCMAIARVVTPTDLETLLRRSAHVLGAAGVTLWVGSGEELLAVLVHAEGKHHGSGGPLTRTADHGAARAWRRATLQTQPADGGSPGSLFAPLIGPGGCSGVLAVDFQNGRESDQLVRAVTVMIAAQLSTVVTGLNEAAAPPVATTTNNQPRTVINTPADTASATGRSR